MKKTGLMSAAKKARIALAVMAVCGMSFVGAQSAFAECKVNTPVYGAIQIGTDAKAECMISIAFGLEAYSNGYESVAIGRSSKSLGEGSISFGAFSEAKVKNSVALGAYSVADEENTISVGGMNEVTIGYKPDGEPIKETQWIKRRITNVDDGTKDTDAATVGQVITNIQKNGNTLEFYTGKGADGSGTKKWEFDLAAGGGSTLTQEQFNDMLDANTKFTGLQTEVGNKANANGDNITTGAGSQWANKLGNGKVEGGNKDLVTGEVVADKLGTITSNNYVNAGNTVNANISALDKQMKVNTDNIGDTSKLNGLGSNLSDAVVNVNNKVGTADELKALKDAGLGDNLAQATAAVNKKADKNAEDIKTVNGRVDELGGRVDTLGGAVSKLDTKVNKVGAGAAALAALHPMEFDSNNKLSFAAGVGNYRGTNAAAIGAFYRPSEQVMFSISGNMGNGENMVNAGVSFALDRPSKTPTTKAALVKTVVAQNEQIAALNETVAEQNEKIARLEAMVQQLAAKQNA